MQTAQALIPVFSGSINDDQTQLVDARTLHRFLEIDAHFRTWIARRVEEYGFQEGEDFRSFLGESSGGRRSREYHVTLDMGKELAMVERNDKGRQARRYFIECEKRLQQIAPQDAATIRGQTIGTNGFNCLAAVLDGKLRLLKGGAKRAAKNHVWQQVHRAFSVVRAEDIPAEQLDSARCFIAAYDVREGEFIQAEKPVKPDRMNIHWTVEELAKRRPEMLVKEARQRVWLDVTLHDLRDIRGMPTPCEAILEELQNHGYKIEGAWWELRTYRNKLLTLEARVRGMLMAIEDPHRYAVDGQGRA